MTLCVYGLARTPVPRRAVSGMRGETLVPIAEGRVTAIAGRFRTQPRPTEATLRRYEATVRALSERVPALLPARFGTCFDDEEEIRLVLRSRRAAFARGLSRVRNRVQMTVRVLIRDGGPSAAGTSARVTEAEPLPRYGTGAAYLRGRAEAAARARAVPGFDPVAAAVRRWVRDERIEHRAGVANVYHLVPRAAAAGYRAAAERAAADAGLPVVVTGPWPAFAFTGE